MARREAGLCSPLEAGGRPAASPDLGVVGSGAMCMLGKVNTSNMNSNINRFGLSGYQRVSGD